MIALGDYVDALVGRFDTLICDPPYSARTHAGHDRKVAISDHGTANSDTFDGVHRRTLDYAALTPDDARALVAWACERVTGWHVVMTDHVLAPVFEAAWRDAGRVTFAPLVWYAPGSRVRLQGDGPACWTVQIVVSRPRSRAYSKWGALPGGYSMAGERKAAVVGAKPLALMRALVRDYSKPGDLVVDPFAGGGTTCLAALIEGRHAAGAEVDPKTHAAASARIAAGWATDMFAQPTRRPSTPPQGDFFDALS